MRVFHRQNFDITDVISVVYKKKSDQQNDFKRKISKYKNAHLKEEYFQMCVFV